MGKVLLLIGVLVFAFAWWTLGRRRDGGAGEGRARRPGKAPPDAPAQMIACAHCGVHLPQTEALFDVAGRPFCSEAHRLAGPR